MALAPHSKSNSLRLKELDKRIERDGEDRDEIYAAVKKMALRKINADEIPLTDLMGLVA